MSDIKDSLNFVSNSFDEYKSILEEKTKLIDVLKQENQMMRTQYDDMQKRLCAVEQQSRECNLELHCVPENRSENLVNLSMQLSSIVKGGLQDNNILAVHRVAKMNKESQRPRSIILKLSSPRCRDTLLAAVKTFNKANSNDKLNTSHVGIGGDTKMPIFVCEHLPYATKQVHAAARIYAKENGIKFVWVRNGRIYLRKNEHSPGHIISDTSCLNRLEL